MRFTSPGVPHRRTVKRLGSDEGHCWKTHGETPIIPIRSLALGVVACKIGLPPKAPAGMSLAWGCRNRPDREVGERDPQTRHLQVGAGQRKPNLGPLSPIAPVRVPLDRLVGAGAASDPQLHVNAAGRNGWVTLPRTGIRVVTWTWKVVIERKPNWPALRTDLLKYRPLQLNGQTSLV